MVRFLISALLALAPTAQANVYRPQGQLDEELWRVTTVHCESGATVKFSVTLNPGDRIGFDAETLNVIFNGPREISPEIATEGLFVIDHRGRQMTLAARMTHAGGGYGGADPNRGPCPLSDVLVIELSK